MGDGIFNRAKIILDFALPLAVFLITLGLGYLIRRILFNRLSRWTNTTKTRLDDIVIAAVKGPFIIWCLMFAIYFSLEVSRLPEGMVLIAGKTFFILGVVSVSLVLSNISGRFIKAYSARLEDGPPGYQPYPEYQQDNYFWHWRVDYSQ